MWAVIKGLDKTLDESRLRFMWINKYIFEQEFTK
jgi:hypothetical protein